MRHFLFIASSLIVLILSLLCGCHDREPLDADGQLTFSRDTLHMDTLYSEQPSSTRTVLVYNRTKDALNIQKIHLLHGVEKGFHINVDGRSGQTFENIIIPAGDSIHIFVEATFQQHLKDSPQLLTDSILFHFRNRSQVLRIEAWCYNIDQEDVLIIDQDYELMAQRPLYIRDSLVVREGATLTLAPGAHLLLGDRAHVSIYGTLLSKGVPDNRVLIEGIRRDYLIPSVNYRQVPGQWDYIRFASSSQGNELAYTTIRNGRDGVLCFGQSPLDLKDKIVAMGTIITNMKGRVLSLNQVRSCWINCELSNSLSTTLDISGGATSLLHCTIVNYYAWDKREGMTLKYTIAEGEEVGQSSLIVKNTLVDGARSVVRIAGKDPMGGEIELDEKMVQRTSFIYCCLRTAIAENSKGIYTNCLEIKEPADKTYVRVGLDRKNNKMDFIYLFQPWADAPWVKQATKTDITTDILGQTRPQKPTIGAYEPSKQKREEIAP